MEKEKFTGMQIYVAKFNKKSRPDDLERACNKFGAVTDIIMKSRYAFIVTQVAQRPTA